jgi:hypothetical protein
MSERFEAIKVKLDAARAHLNQVLDTVGDRTEVQVYSDGAAWNVRQLAIHLSDADRGQSNLVKAIAIGQDPTPADFDLDRYNKRSVEKRAEMTFEQTRESLAATRADLYEWLNAQDESILPKKGRHASLHILSIEQIFDVMANHERDHANDIARALGN